MRKRIFATVLLFMMLFVSSVMSVSAATMTVQYDDGNGTMFKNLPANYVQIVSVGLHNAFVVSGSGYIKTNATTKKNRNVIPTVFWYGTLNYGGNASTSSSAGSLKDNYLPTLTLKYPNCARLSDGTYADIILEVTPVVSVSRPYSSGSFTSSTNVYVPICDSWNDQLEFMCSAPRKSIDASLVGTQSNWSGCNIGIRDKVVIKVCNHTAGNSIGSAINLPSMLLVWNDFDVPDWTTAWGSYTVRYDGKFSEGAELSTGFQNPIVLAPRNSSDAVYNQSYVNAQTINGNTKIKGDGNQYKALNNIGIKEDKNTYYGGMAVSCNPAGSTFYWTGSRKAKKMDLMGSCFGGQPTVAVKSMRGTGGDLTGSGLNYWNTNTHIMNSSATYYYAPANGYFVKRVAVDGVNLSLTDAQKNNGGYYTFTKLNKNPVPKRIMSSGNVLDATAPSYYTIQAEFGHYPAYKDSKITNKKSVRTGSDEEITYVITTDEIYNDAVAGTHELKDDLANGLLKLVPDSLNVHCEYGSYTVNKADDTGIDITFNSNDANGHLPRIAVTYKAKVNWDAFNNSSEEEITNTFNTTHKTTVRVTNDLKLSKKVAGTLRDTTKKFELSVELTNLVPNTEYAVNPIAGGELAGTITGEKTSSGFKSDKEGIAIIKFNLMGGQGAEFKDLPLGAKYTVVEAASDHRPSYKLTSDVASPVLVKSEDSKNVNWTELATSEETIDKKDGIVTVAYTNTRNTTTITGIIDHKDWVVGAVAILALTTILAIVRRKKKNA